MIFENRTIMKKISLLLLTAAFALSLVATSCNKDTNTYVQGTVTVKSDEANPIYLQLDERTVLKPTNMSKNPYGREMRAFVMFIDKGKMEDRLGMEWRNAEICRIDSIRTKLPDPTLGSKEEDEKIYGKDQIDILDSWVTCVEDGYLTLDFRARWGNTHKVKHIVSLVKGTDPNNPYYFDLRHNSNGDDFSGGYHYEEGVIAFDVKDLIDGSKDTYVFTLHYNSDVHAGEHTISINYTPAKK